ncbi:hypothetical protein M409DRAFT_53854 [Zasmidium cellare ATCC 36951]|uniref:Chromosome segregation in meiosis protein n=1 Tax=Zasmidium cellare ATCC 36951 TaxID=1080233 RepID=A0A6A6CL90_ZASCE|nr:uncharacterized protein M409DRAFT_53854 [Zasmidium cellare ATCC 36951]KAF2167905.1 hypothetical protein M409DRAFT_53854 [Zasmidium cellare ATCC 36951]
MPSAASPNPRAGSAQLDELDRLLDYDNAVEDFMRDIPIGNNDQNNQTTAEQPAVDDDQEVQVKKKRKPVPKLDENRLLSDQGIPRLRKITKTRLKFRGKGHEFSDISRLLNTYQLWLDDLYPRAKFRDALAMVEKVGHSKRMQVMRKAWLDDTKTGRRDNDHDVEMSGGLGDGGEDEGAQPSAEDLFQQMLRDEPDAQDSARKSPENDAPDEDELDALLGQNENSPANMPQPSQQKRSGPFDEDDSDEDELDAHLAQSTGKEEPPRSENPSGDSNDPDEDELDTLLAEETTETRKESNSLARGAQSATSGHENENDFAEEEEIMANMGGMW